VMHWALGQSDLPGICCDGGERRALAPCRTNELVAINDGTFKGPSRSLQIRSRYPGADATAHRQAAWAVLPSLGTRNWPPGISAGACGWLLGSRPCLADLALLPSCVSSRRPTRPASNNDPVLAPAALARAFSASEAFSR